MAEHGGTEWPTVVADSWGHWQWIIENLDSIGRADKPTYAFRGHSNAEWGLTPSLCRLLAANGISDAKRALEIEDIARREFIQQAHLYDRDQAASCDCLTDWWAVMQHHEASTRLLDWSLSPWVAAYFAAASSWEVDGAVYVVHIEHLRTRTLEVHGPVGDTRDAQERWLKDPNGPPAIYFARKDRLNARMVAQQGAFSVSGQILADHGEAIRRTLDGPEPGKRFAKVVIPSAAKPEFLRRLRTMNVTASALFPGVDGLGRSINELVRLAPQE